MFDPFDYPVSSILVAFVFFWIAARIGAGIGKRRQNFTPATAEEFTLLLGALLTLLGLIIGFTFSMAVGRYDQRKNLEEAEANAIGTEYVRVDVLPAAEAAEVRSLLKAYLDQRIAYYETRDRDEQTKINAQTAALQNGMWRSVLEPAKAHETPVMALAVAGMNDVLNSQGYTQAAWWNRIPLAAWVLLMVISLLCNFMVGFRDAGQSDLLLLILPIALAMSLFLIADIDSPRRGAIRVRPQNLESLAQSLSSQ